ncbi:MAG: 23S rRNA (adenine(2503)-C(2))-methyltransferase RlmN [Firmicutes bacterium]|nr:23S rRNA (adenine(2503)-C(2))-methyltransferase RlmN [Alicyclobacillaceae bacterium]MCL6496434.1 23S rRNA (adenine(2503)-C(2))-methyltransferase RlmN [Bacillota bacterium]
MVGWGEPSWRGRQWFEWLWRHGVDDYDAITVWPKSLRQAMAARAPFQRGRVFAAQMARDGTVKWLLEWPDGERVETVYLPHPWGDAVCISTQVGCNMGCRFCASGLVRRVRNLTAGEMLEQVRVAWEWAARHGRRLGRIDLMGIGEPLDNWAEVERWLELVHRPEGFGFSYRHITLSTAGVVPAIDRLAERGWPLTLAISLHAPDDALRTRLMPLNRAYPLAELLPAAARFAHRTGRRVTFEYALLAGVNDAPEQAVALAQRLRGIPCHVNLIPWNPVPEHPFRPTPPERVRAFQERVQAYGISCTIRKEMGQAIEAACGQLRRRAKEAQPSP